MKTRIPLLLLTTAALVLPPTTAVVAAQRSANAATVSASATPQITGFDVDQVPQLTPGSELRFTVNGTPGAQALLQIDGARRPLLMTEVRPGVYEGFYTISSRDDIKPDATVSANLRGNGRVGTATLDEPLQSGWRPVAQAGVDQPRIERFEAKPVTDRGGIQRIEFRVVGTPGSRASVRMVGVQSRVRLDERRSGEYIGSYTLQPNDRPSDKDPIVAQLRRDRQVATAQITDVSDVQRYATDARSAACLDCATVVAINPVAVEGDGNYIGGTVAGGVLGAILGNQVGGGSGKTAARVAGAVGGAMIGREIQKRNDDPRQRYEVVVEMSQDRSRRVVSYDAAPDLRVGQQVRVNDGQLTAR